MDRLTNPLPRAFPPEIVARLPELVEGKVCADCRGKGKVKVRYDKPTQFGISFYLQSCVSCQGEGRVYEPVVTVERMEQPLEGMEFHRIVLDSIAQFQRPKPHGGIGLQEIPLPYRVGDVRVVAEEWDTVRESDDGEDDGEQVPQLRSKVRVDFGNHPMLACIHPYPADTMPDYFAHLCKYRGRVVGVSVKRMEEVTHEEWESAGYSDDQLAANPYKWAITQFAKQHGYLSEDYEVQGFVRGQFTSNPYVALPSWRFEVAG